MLTLFKSVKDIIKVRNDTPCIDNFIFKLHYRFSTIIFVVSSILVTSREYFGEKIKCVNDSSNRDFQKFVETYCFFSSTFTVVDQDANKFGFLYLPHEGVVPYQVGSAAQVKKHFYYQWVPYVLLCQAVFFYFTHIFWKNLESGRVKNIVSGLTNATFALLEKEVKVNATTIPTKKKKKQCINEMKDVFLKQITTNKSWARWFMICEILNFFNVALQIFATNEFLGKQFLNLGPSLIKNGSKVLDQVFPKVTKCTFHKFGSSGTIEIHDTLCIMALNIINEKIYVFLWFWLIALFIASSYVLIWRLVTIVLYSKSIRFNQFIFGYAARTKMYPWRLKTFLDHCNYSDWLFLRYLSKNMDCFVFRELFDTISEDLDEQKRKFDCSYCLESE